MSVFDRLRKNQFSEFTTPTLTTVTTLEGEMKPKQAKYPPTVVKVVTVGVVNPENEKIDFSENPDWDIRQTAEGLTNWRPPDAWFLRRHIPYATIDEIHAAYWLTVGYVGTITGIQPERAKQYAVSDILVWREVKMSSAH